MAVRPNRSTRKRVSVNTRMEAFLAGNISLDEMDEEEIRRGEFRALDGTFRGRPVDIVPRKFHEELVRLTINRMNEKFRQDLEPMQEILRDIASNPRLSADARMKSAIYLIERVLGKVPEKTIVEATVKKWEDDIDDLFVD